MTANVAINLGIIDGFLNRQISNVQIFSDRPRPSTFHSFTSHVEYNYNFLIQMLHEFSSWNI